MASGLPLDLLTRGVDRVYPSVEALQRRLVGRRPVKLYLGIDPTSPDLHLGHTVVLNLLKRFQVLGHDVTLLVGDFTATVGDPSGRDTARSVLAAAQIARHMAAYRAQVFTMLDPKRTTIRYNSEWYDDPRAMGKLRQFLELSHHFTAAQLAERDLFHRRQAEGSPVSLTEFLYPVLQAYDSVALDVDIEVGGTDQTFNMLAGRTLVKQKLGKEKFVITVPLLVGGDGRKMSKSFGNSINLGDEPRDQFGKVMALPDELLESYFQLVTDRVVDGALKQLIAADPRTAKLALAADIVSRCHGPQAATIAERYFINVFTDRNMPDNMPDVALTKKPTLALELVSALPGISSRSEAQRLIRQGGVTLDGVTLTDPFSPVSVGGTNPVVVQIGKRRFFRVALSGSADRKRTKKKRRP